MGPVERDIAERLGRIAEENEATRVFISVANDTAVAAARSSDARKADGSILSPLDGVSVAVKGNIAVDGLPWTVGIAGLKDRIAEKDATVAARLRAAGAVILGSLNMEEGALGAVTDNPTFGRCLNPLGEGLTPGGSSGGSGAAVASGYVDLALGTDTMGSVRIPAAYCGVAGLKPTRGLVGRGGLDCLSPSLDAIGPITSRAIDLSAALEVVAGPDPADPESLSKLLAPEAEFRGVRLAIPRQIELVQCEREVRDAFISALNAARELGAEVVELDLVGWNPSQSRRAGFLLAEAEGAVELAALIDQDGALSPSFRANLAFGRDAPSAKLVAALAIVRAAAATTDRALIEADALMLPTAPQRAFAHGAPIPANQADFTALANFHGGPAAAFPVPVPGETLPSSVQIIGPHFSDHRLIGWAAKLEAALA